jgi:adenosylmethionine-8-amino-7-oxononanoate aminotransferase
VYVFDDQGNRYLDACGGAAVVSIGHGVAEIVETIAEAGRRLSYVHSSAFHTEAAHELAATLAARFPGGSQSARVHFTSGGSEATETAIKIVRQYWLSRGEEKRDKIISRWQSYHGCTLGALSLSGNQRRRKPYESLLPPTEHISACFCYRCPLELQYPSCRLACAHELEETIARIGPESVAAFILEPVVGATTGAVPPDDYLPVIREICDRHGVLLVADEVLTGSGRTGTYFAMEHWNVVPDIILLGKGLSSGYAPLGAVLAGENVWKAIQSAGGRLEHGFTYQEHPPSLAAGLAVQRYLDRHDLVQCARVRGEYFGKQLLCLQQLPHVGNVRGKGLLQTVELVAEAKSRTPFPIEIGFVERVFEELRGRGVLVYPMRGTADGTAGEHIMLAPPFVISEEEVDTIVDSIKAVLSDLSSEFA